MKVFRQFLRRASGPVLLAVAGILAACGKPASLSTGSGDAGSIHTITDGADRIITLPPAPQRIVSLSPAATDILVAEGAHGQIAGATRYCNIPVEDEKRVVRIGGVMDPDFERILEKLAALGLPVLVLHPEGLPGVIDDLRLVGKASGHEAEGEAKAKTIENICAFALNRWKDMPPEKHPRVLIDMEGESPAPGSYVDDLLTVAGGRNVLPRGNKAWVEVSPERSLQLAPDMIIEIPSTDQLANPEAKAVVANSTRVVKLANGSIFYHPGPDLGLALWDLARAIDPARFPEATPPLTPQIDGNVRP